MRRKIFHKDRLALTISVALGATALPQVLMAQQADVGSLEEVTVTGIRGSLTKSMDVKRDSDGIVDAISAEDIGKFPDTNLAESMQRISGVSIDRVNGEGSKVTVRGIDPEFNLVTLNGRQLARTTGGRSFDFQNIASEMVTGVSVAKSSNALVPSGGIGSTIDLLTARPLEIGERRINFAAKGVMDESSEDAGITPEYSGFYSETFADGKIGVAISASVAERESGSQQALVGTGWRSFEGTADNTNSWGGVPQDNQVNRPGPSDVYSVPQTTIYKFEEQQRKRTNGQLVLQWAPTDDVTATMDYMYYANDISKQHNDISAWYNFVPSENVWTDGPVASPLIYSETFDAPTDLSMAAGGGEEAYRGESIGINLEWQVSDRLALEFDAHHSDAERRPDSPWGSSFNLSTAAFIRTQSATDFTEELPALYVDNGNSVQPSDMRVTGSVFGNSRDYSEIDAFRFSGNFELNESSDIDFGISSQEVTNHSQSINVQRNAWGGVGAEGDFDDSFFPADSIQDKFDIATGDFSEVDGISAGDIQDVYFAWDFEKVRARAEELYGADLEAGFIGDCGTQFCASTDYSQDVDRTTTEKTTSLYAQYNFESELTTGFGSMPYDIHFGLRYEDTEVDSKSAAATYAAADWIADTEIALLGSGERAFLSQTGSYDYWLPSVNVNVELRDDLVMRAAASQTIGRPDYDSIKGGTVVGSLANQQGGSGSAGNPNLLPLESVNFDLSLEWYYGESSYVSAGWFQKEISNFITQSKVESTIFELANPTDGARYDEARAAVGTSDARLIREYIFANYGDTALVDPASGVISGDPATDNLLVFTIDTPTNSDRDETIDGLELAVQHMFGDTGFGVIANYTKVESGLEYNPFLLEDQEALVGLSDSANLIGFYDKNGLQARIAYNWRDDFLNSRGQDTGANPKFTEAYNQIDLNVSYEVPQVDGLQVFLEGLNVTDEYAREHGRAQKQVLGVYQGGPRWQLGARYAF
ncbi:TonB-dependent receptor [Microbulbifer donghaiensis]|uniref:TonB-dependent receptor n=1 Tax=Microbulbifer donghaiensis TaxID=494016 RepID=A0A1M5B5N1_9GAMM|nr:TonB-dependent receptor [Microbulbifer donghaiensis]SHF37502.1 TonB-dependent receptor [Microbulbifer donghaiensis]